jgi:hypothetical protein
MEALEFTAKIDHGTIRLPKQFEAYDNAFVRIIILSEEPRNFSEKKEKFRNLLLKMQETDVFRKIKNPVEWQKKLRDEWE